MKITAQNIAVLDDDKDALLSRWVEAGGRLDHDASLPEHYLRYIKPGDVVVDGGAAIGDHTIAYMQACGPAGVVHAFEPNPLMLECLIYNCPGCVFYPCALSDVDGVARLLHIDGNAGASYLTSDGTGIVVPTCRLDSYELAIVDFIKLDLEGYEAKAIAGASETLKRCRPKMVMEVSPLMLKRAGSSMDALFQLLTDLRYGWNVELGEMPTTDEGRAEVFCYPQ